VVIDLFVGRAVFGREGCVPGCSARAQHGPEEACAGLLHPAWVPPSCLGSTAPTTSGVSLGMSVYQPVVL
jgi:hypothetical protein